MQGLIEVSVFIFLSQSFSLALILHGLFPHPGHRDEESSLTHPSEQQDQGEGTTSLGCTHTTATTADDQSDVTPHASYTPNTP